MKVSEFPALLRGLEIPGAFVRPTDGRPGSDIQHGFIVTEQHDARMTWRAVIQEGGGLPLHFGLRLDLDGGDRVFIQALWILEPGEVPNDKNKYRMREAA